MDFTLSRYEELLTALLSSKIKTYSIRSWIEKKPDAGVFIRHDVDRFPACARDMAEVEIKLGVDASYYFRSGPATFNPEIISYIASGGLEIGYHYEDLSSQNGDVELALASFRDNLAAFRKIAPVSTVVMHGSPLSPHDNRTLLEHHDLDSFGLVGDALVSVDYHDIFYLTDTGRSWADTSKNIRDKPRMYRHAEVKTTEDMISMITSNTNASYCLVCHPERWPANKMGWLRSLSFDTGSNIAKSLLSLWPGRTTH